MAKQRDRGAKDGTTHRWAVDQVEEGTAAVEQDGDHVYQIPRFLIPAGAHDGDILAVTMTPSSADDVTITVRIDRAAGSAAAKKSRSRRPIKDSGGDIVL